jgi:hypothetical protein
MKQASITLATIACQPKQQTAALPQLYAVCIVNVQQSSSSKEQKYVI